MASPQTYGVTPPISTNLPTKREELVTGTLMVELKKQNTFESEEEARTRELVLGRVAGLVKKFVHQVCLQRGLSEAAAAAAGGKIFTFGSYRLGVHGPGSDIDTLCVVPKHVAREDFFLVFEPMLREFEGVTEVSGVPEAYVPIIKVKISGIPIDFLFARLALATIPEDLELRDDNLLRNLDERCVRSLGGSRVTDEILRLVPNVAVFRDSLRCIKLWAQRRAIYSNVNGFLGGVAWSMLVARICQLYPSAVAGGIISRFFTIMHQWNWPQPVLLKQIEEGPLNVRVWNPKLYPSDRAHRMPIITPAYPAMCSTHNVTKSTQLIMTQECKRAAGIVDKIVVGTGEWSELFAKHDFFYKYRYYLQIIASTANSELQLKWAGTVESRIRQLVMKLELVDSIDVAHPFVKGFDRTYHCASPDEVNAVARGEVPEAVNKRKKEDIEGQEGGGTVYATSFFIGLEIQPKKAGAVGPRKLDISYPTTEFTKMVKMWDHFDDDRMGIVVRHIKSTVLPDYLFENDDRQPRAALKRTKSGKVNTKNDTPNKKRRSSLAPSSELQSPQLQNSKVDGTGTTPMSTPIIEIPKQTLPSYAGMTKSPTGLKSPAALPFSENTAVSTGRVS
ncbi:poly-A polymerase [Gautieria morchelliformis]|nr:poly-A polymerase [Gautieria morchelliformis]